MASWKKVVVSGSDANLKSLVVSQSVSAESFVGTLYGTSSWAENAVTYSSITSSTIYTISASYVDGFNGQGLTISIPTASYTWSLNHNLNTDFPAVSIWESESKEIILPDIIRSIDPNNVEVTFTEPQKGYANVILTGAALYNIVSSSISASIAEFAHTASYVNTARTASYVVNSVTASYVTPYEGAWTSYTPIWTAASTNPVIGNGTAQGWYKVIGKTCFVRGNIAMGSTTTYGSGEWYVSMPLTASHADAILMTVTLLDNGSAWYNATMAGARAGSNHKAPMQYQHISNGTANDVNSAQPFTWANTDRFIWNGSYEIA